MIAVCVIVACASLVSGARGGASLSAAKVAGEAGEAACDKPLGGASSNDSAVVGTWYLLHCFTSQDVKCTEKNCLRFDLTTPEDRKQLPDVCGPQLTDVKWDSVVLKVVTPCPTGVQAMFAPNYLEKTAPGAFRLISSPLFGTKQAVQVHKPRPVRLELIREEFLVMLNCADLEPVIMVQRAPAPGYRDDPVISGLLQYYDY